MKSRKYASNAAMSLVAPFVGAWIEIVNRIDIFAICPVAPFVGAWIEIFGEMPFVCFEWKSLPSWERGLKFINGNSYVLWGTVAPFVGAWIEIL